jgi:hypothetical protein
MIRYCLESQRHDGILTLLSHPAEALTGIASSSIDVVVSNAVLEHVADLGSVATELARVTVSRGINLHQIDFRDHRDFDAPLEFLLIDDATYKDQDRYGNWRYIWGNRLRPSEVAAMFLSVGFDNLAIEVNAVADRNYLDNFLPRLRSSSTSYRSWPEGDLATTGANFLLRNSGDPAARIRGQQLLAEIAARRWPPALSHT